MLSLNNNYSLPNPTYQFPEISRRVTKFSLKNPDKPLYNLGLGDPTQPLIPLIARAMIKKIKKMVSGSEYMGYRDFLGQVKLRNSIVNYYKNYLKVNLHESEIFVSDGAKTDLFNIQTIFESNIKVVLQNPSYPTFIDSLIINGKAGVNNSNIVFITGSPENNFIPKAPSESIDLFYLCFPNNPTGVTATKKQLQEYVDYANKNGAIIVFDSVYSWFIQDNNYPRSIYQISGADKCAIEIQSFSKLAGFSGIRLGWTIVPFNISNKYINKHSVNVVWRKRQQIGFNGASIIAQEGGIAALSNEGIKENKKNINYYIKNISLIKKTFDKLGFKSYGSANAPYLWVETPKKMKSWVFFDYLLDKTGVICTPGIIFGTAGEGFFRISGFAKKEVTKKAMNEIINSGV